jgi:hypothetical protein
MKKYYLVFLGVFLAIILSAGVSNARAKATVGESSDSESQSDSQSVVTGSNDSNSSTQDQNRVENEVENRENNPDIGEMTEAEKEARVESDIEESKSEYEPKNDTARSRRSKVATAAEELIRASMQISNSGVGDQIRTIAQTQNEYQDEINRSIDNSENRSAFARFFIGPNYTELKNIQRIMEQNRLQIRVLEQLRLQLQNEGEETNIQSQISVLQEQNIALENELDNLDDGFSLFGWISRWLAKYSN